VTKEINLATALTSRSESIRWREGSAGHTEGRCNLPYVQEVNGKGVGCDTQSVVVEKLK